MRITPVRQCPSTTTIDGIRRQQLSTEPMGSVPPPPKEPMEAGGRCTPTSRQAQRLSAVGIIGRKGRPLSINMSPVRWWSEPFRDSCCSVCVPVYRCDSSKSFWVSAKCTRQVISIQCEPHLSFGSIIPHPSARSTHKSKTTRARGVQQFLKLTF